jgi:ATP-dependent helicase HrpB
MRCSDAVSSVLAAAAAPRFARLFPETGDYGDMLARLRFAESVSPNEEWPDWIQKPELLLGDWVSGRRSFEALQKINLCADLASRLPWNLKQRLDTVAPERMTVPSGAKIRLEYPAGAAPVLAARVQQMFGLMHTPKLGGVAITVQLLAPNGRPAQVTKDLAGFWATSYAEVRKALRGRYPRHAWPEDPSVAIPENRPKRRRPRS